MKLDVDARRALPVHSVLKSQSHEKRCENILQDRAPIKSNSWIVVKESA